MPEHAAFVLDAVLPLMLRNMLIVAQLALIGAVVVQIAAPAAVVSAIGIGIGRLLEGRQRGALERVMLAEALCPGCAYDVGALEAGEQGLTVCPECGGGWAMGDAEAGLEDRAVPAAVGV